MTQNTILLELDFGDLEPSTSLQLSNCRKSKFLIGCYRSKDKKQLDWILGKSNRQFALYNVRSGKKRDGWVNVQNPKVKAPDIVLMYDLENPTDYIAYKVSACKEYSEQEMANLLGINRSVVARHIKTLQEKGIIRRIGPDKGGHWEIL